MSRTVSFNEMVEGPPALDRVYRALADPTRRRLLTALRKGDARITDLAEPLPMSFAAVARHVATLEEAGLVNRDVRGREHWLSVRPAALHDAQAWIADQTEFWEQRADALARHLEKRRR
jgi:DNA-binding transcriptional ArsR family regulator